MKFAELLRAYRIRSGLTQKEMANTLDVPLSTYRLWEYGSTLPKMDTWTQISYYFDTDVTDAYITERTSKYQQ